MLLPSLNGGRIGRLKGTFKVGDNASRPRFFAQGLQRGQDSGSHILQEENAQQYLVDLDQSIKGKKSKEKKKVRTQQ